MICSRLLLLRHRVFLSLVGRKRLCNVHRKANCGDQHLFLHLNLVIRFLPSDFSFFLFIYLFFPTSLPLMLRILIRSVHVCDADNCFFHFEMLAVLCWYCEANGTLPIRSRIAIADSVPAYCWAACRSVF